MALANQGPEPIHGIWTIPTAGVQAAKWDDGHDLAMERVLALPAAAPFLLTNTGSDSRLLLTVEELDRTRDTPADCVTASPGQMSQAPPPGRTLSQTHLRLLPLMSRLGDGQAALLAGRVY